MSKWVASGFVINCLAFNLCFASPHLEEVSVKEDAPVETVSMPEVVIAVPPNSELKKLTAERFDQLGKSESPTAQTTQSTSTRLFNFELSRLSYGASRSGGSTQTYLTMDFSTQIRIRKTGTSFTIGILPTVYLNKDAIVKDETVLQNARAEGAIANIFGVRPEDVPRLAQRNPELAEMLDLFRFYGRLNVLGVNKTNLDPLQSVVNSLNVELRQKIGRITVSAGRNFLEPFAKFVPTITSLIFGPVVHVSARGDFKFGHVSFTQFSDRGTAFVRSVFPEAGLRTLFAYDDNPSRIRMDSWLATAGADEAQLKKLGLKVLSSLVIGFGQRTAASYGTATVEVRKGNWDSENVLYLSAHKQNGFGGAYLGHHEYRLRPKVTLGSNTTNTWKQGPSQSFAQASGFIERDLFSKQLPVFGEKRGVLSFEYSRIYAGNRNYAGLRGPEVLGYWKYGNQFVMKFELKPGRKK